jgi:hypothetical protein
MSKYIDAEKLKAEIENIALFPTKSADYNDGREDMKMMILDIIDSLQQGQTEIEKEAEISPSVVSNFGPCAFNLSVALTQDEMEKMNIAPFLTKKVNIIIKDAE